VAHHGRQRGDRQRRRRAARQRELAVQVEVACCEVSGRAARPARASRAAAPSEKILRFSSCCEGARAPACGADVGAGEQRCCAALHARGSAPCTRRPDLMYAGCQHSNGAPAAGAPGAPCSRRQARYRSPCNARSFVAPRASGALPGEIPPMQALHHHAETPLPALGWHFRPVRANPTTRTLDVHVPLRARTGRASA
jgi:hypothetical protein